MPYKSIEALPAPVKKALPKGALQIFRKVFNSAIKEYADPEKRRGNDSKDTVARKVAWSVVKKTYRKAGDHWVKK